MTPNSYQPPRGIMFYTRMDRPASFFIRWRDPQTLKKTTKAFEEEADRETFAKKLEEGRKRNGEQVLSFDPKEWQTWLEFKRLVGDTSPLIVAAEWLAAKRDGRASAGIAMTVEQAVEKYISARADEGLSSGTMRHFKTHLKKRFCGALGKVQLHELTSEQIRDWMRGLTHPQTGAPMELLTKRHHRKDVNSFLIHCVSERWITSNPCRAVKPPRIEEDDVTILTVEEAQKLFDANKDEPIIGRLAIEAFAGFRFSSVQRLTKDRLNFTDKGIELPGRDHKSKRRKYVEGHPDNLWKWIERAPEKCWEIKPSNYLRLKADAFTRAGLKNPGNVLRKSFCSYHLAAYRNAPLTAFLLQHASPKMLYAEYNGVATKAAAEAYFKIAP
jgi:site-specific recombinase XerD